MALFLHKMLLVLALVCCVALCSAQQLLTEGGAQKIVSSSRTDVYTFKATLDSLSSTDFTTLTHPVFPNYGVRIKKSNFCDGQVRTFTGYIDFGARHLFFYFFESRSNPSADDVIFWTNGGPGCSSTTGLFMELGPCQIDVHGNLTWNPYSWNERANIFFIDQPVGTGFSYAQYGEHVANTEEAARDIAAFIAIFFEHFDEYKGRPFHMAGESYGGRMVPVYASAIYDENAKLGKMGMTPVNLSSIMLGNGCTDWGRMLPSYWDMQCTPKSVPPPLDIGTCVQQKLAVPRCAEWLQKGCYDTFDKINCAAAFQFCSESIVLPFNATGTNPYNMAQPCDGTIDKLCTRIPEAISTFLNQPSVRATLGADKAFSQCNPSIKKRFWEDNLDMMFPTQHYIAALLERGVRVLIYVGANDWVCNWVGNERMTLAMEWTGQATFAAKPLRPWVVGDRAVGLTRREGLLTFATIYGAGHLAPHDKPEESFAMLTRWLADKDL